MGEADAKVEAFYGKVGPWKEEAAALRAILRETPLTEEFKWRGPCYTYGGGNIVTVWRMKDKCALGFFKGVLLSDPDRLLAAPGENSRSMRVAGFTSVAQIGEKKAALTACIAEAIEKEKAGLKVDLPKDDFDPPPELTEALESDPELKKAFEALTPGRQRGYILHFSGAKQSATRTSRIDKARPRILQGKGIS